MYVYDAHGYATHHKLQDRESQTYGRMRFPGILNILIIIGFVYRGVFVSSTCPLIFRIQTASVRSETSFHFGLHVYPINLFKFLTTKNLLPVF